MRLKVDHQKSADGDKYINYRHGNTHGWRELPQDLGDVHEPDPAYYQYRQGKEDDDAIDQMGKPGLPLGF